MARYIGPKRRLSRREGLALFGKDAKILERKGAIPPGQHGLRTRRRVSEYGLQLREKQKAKRMFGILEKQFKKYFNEASRFRGSTGLKILELLESRLDNIVYRLGFTQSRMQARQLISHGHIRLDGKKINIPSHHVKEGQTIALSEKLSDNTQIKKALSDNQTLPEWLKREATLGKVLRMPERSEMEQSIDEQLIVEYYSR
ncbi:30S ribosomal protein S4 [Candidatus Daviesbacteria bacterium]|nr:30S ribosomal protein S4 [Candidatus Daviesbacteria bacterium]